MKTHLSYREIKYLLLKTREDLKKNLIETRKALDDSGRVSRHLLIEADIMEDILEKLTIAKLKCESKFEKLVSHSISKKKKLH
jgi:hypothetical protein